MRGRGRIERDPLGEKEVPRGAYYGIQTARAVENFPISGLRLPREFIRATAIIKRSAARVNLALGLLKKDIAEAIIRAAEEVASGILDDHFVVDVYQAGAGTSQNMNTNEVIANRAIELLGGERGNYTIVHPNDHVNMAQSTNDVFPTAMRLSCLEGLEGLLETLDRLHSAFMVKAKEFSRVVKAGRTHLQDAMPITLGQEFHAYGTCVKRHSHRLRATMEDLTALGIGGTAVGTGINAHPRYPAMMVEELSRETGYSLSLAEDLFEAMESMAPFTRLSGALRDLSLDLIRIANDLRLMASGPGAGLAEIELPPVQPGSSIMPGKVNPVMAEALNMVCFQVVGNDTTIAMASQAGQLELNVMMPVIAHNLLYSLRILRNGIEVFTERCITGIRAREGECRRWAERTMALVTVLAPKVGYERAAYLAKKARSEGRSLKDTVVEEGVLSREEAERLLDPMGLTGPGIPALREEQER